MTDHLPVTWTIIRNSTVIGSRDYPTTCDRLLNACHNWMRRQVVLFTNWLKDRFQVIDTARLHGRWRTPRRSTLSAFASTSSISLSGINLEYEALELATTGLHVADYCPVKGCSDSGYFRSFGNRLWYLYRIASSSMERWNRWSWDKSTWIDYAPWSRRWLSICPWPHPMIIKSIINFIPKMGDPKLLWALKPWG